MGLSVAVHPMAKRLLSACFLSDLWKWRGLECFLTISEHFIERALALFLKDEKGEISVKMYIAQTCTPARSIISRHSRGYTAPLLIDGGKGRSVG